MTASPVVAPVNSHAANQTSFSDAMEILAYERSLV